MINDSAPAETTSLGVPLAPLAPPRRRSIAPLLERLSRRGAAGLSDAELVALLLDGPLERRLAVATRVIWETGGAVNLLRFGLAELRALGLSVGEAARLVAVSTLGSRPDDSQPLPRAVREPADAYACVARDLVDAERECFVVIVLDVRNRPRAVVKVAEGAVDHCPVDPREVFLPAVRERGSAVVLAHNHPSGDPDPSAEDLALTQRLAEAGRALGIPVLDHLIIGGRVRHAGAGSCVAESEMARHTGDRGGASPSASYVSLASRGYLDVSRGRRSGLPARR